uniref:BHLH domain-containing protein n=1 Tax=Scophthalmus maximus TaxID=52904 RepID=A0A8D3B5Y3_SCOMX
MAPTITAQEHLTLSHKVRKPLVEKLRRERINSSIEQLKCLLAPELVQQQPDSKLEKADVLEMTVCFLTRLQQRRPMKTWDQLQSDFSPLSWSQVFIGLLCCSRVRKQTVISRTSAFSSLESGCCWTNSGARRHLSCSMLLLIRSLRNFSTRGFLTLWLRVRCSCAVMVGAMAGSALCWLHPSYL